MSGFGTPARWWEEPRYVETGGPLVFRQPSIFEDVRMYSFVLEADSRRLDRFLERSFNEPLRGRFEYRSYGGHVLLNLTSATALKSGHPDQLGSTEELEVVIWILAKDAKQEGAAPVWTVPYMFVNAPAAVAGGREIYGFPKQLASMKIPHHPHLAPQAMSVRAPALKQFGPHEALKEREVIRVDRDPPQYDLLAVWESEPGPDQFTLGNALAARSASTLDVVMETLKEWRLLSALGEQLRRRTVPIVLLKQFRSAVNPDLACYQAVIGVDLEMTAVRRLGLLPDDYTVTLHELANEPFARELGLKPEMKPKTAFWLDFDFRLGSATTVAKLDIQ